MGEHTPSRGKIALSQVIGLRDKHICVKQVLRPYYAVFVEYQSMLGADMLKEEVRILISERVGSFGASWVIAGEDRFGGQAVCGAELELEDMGSVD